MKTRATYKKNEKQKTKKRDKNTVDKIRYRTRDFRDIEHESSHRNIYFQINNGKRWEYNTMAADWQRRNKKKKTNGENDAELE